MRGFSMDGAWLGDRKRLLSGLEVAEVAEVEQTILPLEAVDLNDKEEPSVVPFPLPVSVAICLAL